MASKSARKRRKRRRPAAPDAPAPEEPTTPRSPAPAATDPTDERPPAPWGSFPLVELCVLAGLVMLVLGFFVVSGERGTILIAAGLALGSIGGLDLTLREHFAGYRSHTMILAGVPAIAVLAVLFYAGPDEIPAVGRAAIALAVFAGAAVLLSRAFSRRSGGLRYRFGPLRTKK